ncbi:hypothetical protein LJC63_06345 [Ruminococcaceae bacterium OttesenSCG-928-L11]|nr:hypothetical protein [Ruminococcaceae bacterium OttesenSCG-928-L11]
MIEVYKNPYQDTDAYLPLKVNFHTHAGVCVKGKCGELPMDAVAQAYKQAGYHAVAISNHNMYLPKDETIEGIELLDAIEYSEHPHLIQVGVTEFQQNGHQQAISDANDAGGFAILCHPNWINKEYWNWEHLEEVTGFAGIEILNPVIYRLSGSGLALDTWDHLLSRGRLVYGFGNDDFHQWRDMERAYNVIFAKSAALQDIAEAVRHGRFYVSSGVLLKWLRYDGETLCIEAGFAGKSSYIREFEYRFIGYGGKVLEAQRTHIASYRPDHKEPYLRVEVISENGARLYLQPMVLPEFFGKTETGISLSQDLS